MAEEGKGYRRASTEFDIPQSTIKSWMRRTKARAASGVHPADDQGYEAFLVQELAEAKADRVWMRRKNQGQAIESNRRSIRDIRKELEAVREARKSKGGLYDVHAFIARLVSVPDEIWDEAMRQRGLR